MKRPDGLTVLSVYHFLVAALSLAGVCAGVAALVAIGFYRSSYAPNTSILLGLVAILFFISTVANVIAGWGLFKMLAWSRWLSLALGALSLPLFPIGTLIGGVTIWYLMQPEVTDALQVTPTTEPE